MTGRVNAVNYVPGKPSVLIQNEVRRINPACTRIWLAKRTAEKKNSDLKDFLA